MVTEPPADSTPAFTSSATGITKKWMRQLSDPTAETLLNNDEDVQAAMWPYME